MSDNEICTELCLAPSSSRPDTQTETETGERKTPIIKSFLYFRSKIRKLMEFLGSLPPSLRCCVVLVLILVFVYIVIFIVNFRQTESLAEHLKPNNFFSFSAFCIFLSRENTIIVYSLGLTVLLYLFLVGWFGAKLFSTVNTPLFVVIA